MTDLRFSAIMSACQAIPAALAACFAAWFSYRSAILGRQTLESAEKTRVATDGMSDKLIAITAKASHAEGVLAEKQNHPND